MHTQRLVDSRAAAQAARPDGCRRNPAWAHPHRSKKYPIPGGALAGTPSSWAPPRNTILFPTAGELSVPTGYQGAPARAHT